MVTAERTPPPADGGQSITVARSAGTVVVTVRGELDAERSQHLGGILADLIDGQGNRSILVDLHEASTTDPDCLWMLTEAAERAHRRGATMRLDVGAEVTSALQLRGLDVFIGRSAEPA